MNLQELRKIREEIILQFKNGKSVEVLAEKYNARWSDIYNIVSTCLRHSIDTVTDKEKQEIINLYNNKLSCPKIGIKLNIYHKQVAEILEANGIKRSYSSKRKYELDEHYFDKIDTPNKAYILGLFYADGYNAIDKSTIRIQLQYTDMDLLEKIRLELKSNKPLKFIKCSDKIASNGYISKDMYQLEFYSTHICKCLENHGMVQNKSLVLKYPDCISPELHKHFIRGYFDGDGSYCHKYIPKHGNKDIVTITSTCDFCKKVKEILNDNKVILGGGIYDASNHNGITKVLSISGKYQTQSFLNWIYEDAEMYLDRKYIKYRNAYVA